MEESKRWVYLICLTATCSLFLSFLLQATVVGIFFVLPYFSDCDTGLFSPLELNTCLTSSARSSNFTLPPSCGRNSSLSISYCSQASCELNAKSSSCSAPRCCCRSIPQIRSLVCMDERFDASINMSCVYTTCERSLHSVLVQVYPVSNMSLPPLYVRIGRNTLRTNGSMVLFANLAEGEYAVSIGGGGPNNLSTEYFHASRLIVDFNSPPELVYIVYVKQLMPVPNSMVGTCMVPDNTTKFSNSIGLFERLTLPNNFLYNETLFIPEFLAFTSSMQAPTNFSITCTNFYHLFQYSGTTWIDRGRLSSFNIASQENGVLWALSSIENQTNLTLTFCVDSVGSALSVDRGAVALVFETGSLFASRVALSNNAVSSIPVPNRTNLEICFVTSPFSQVSSDRSPPAMIRDGYLSMPLNNCENPYIPVNSSILTAVLSETNLPDSTQSCYYLINNITTQTNPMNTLIFSILVMNSTDNSTVSFSTLETNAARACVRYPCTSQDACLVSVGVKGGASIYASTKTCSSLGRTSLSECNLQTRR